MVEEVLADMRSTLKPLWYGYLVGRSPPLSQHKVPLTQDQISEARKVLNEQVLPIRFQQLENILLSKSNPGPYFCGEKMTICDLSFYVFASGLVDGSFVEGVSHDVLNGCTGLLKLEQLVRQHPKVREWEESHGQDPYVKPAREAAAVAAETASTASGSGSGATTHTQTQHPLPKPTTGPATGNE